MQFLNEALKLGAMLSPMAGATDATMRKLSVQFGASITVSEMVSAKALTFQDKKSVLLMGKGGGNAPYGIQLFGAVPQDMAQAVARIQDMQSIQYDFFDINMGCPAPKITGSGAGSALLKNLPLLEQIAQATVKASSVPVSAKMRLGWEDTYTAIEAAKRCESAGISFITLHGRTRQEMYHPGIHVPEMAKVKSAVKIPVLANGDITSAQGALELMEQTGCDGVAVGRGAMGNPWLFAEIAAAMQGKPMPQTPNLQERLNVMRTHIYDMCCDKGEFVAMQQARSHAGWYMHGLRGAAVLRKECCALSHFADIDRLIQLAYSLQKEA